MEKEERQEGQMTDKYRDCPHNDKACERGIAVCANCVRDHGGDPWWTEKRYIIVSAEPDAKDVIDREVLIETPEAVQYRFEMAEQDDAIDAVGQIVNHGMNVGIWIEEV